MEGIDRNKENPFSTKLFTLTLYSFLIENFPNKDNINQTSNEMKSGEVCLIENIRFQKEEENIDIMKDNIK